VRNTALAATLACLAAPIAAEPRFENLSATLPPHSYTGGWEHFVGGGVAVFDCDGDDLPEIAAAGGTSPAILLRNQGDMRFETDPAFPDILETTGLYPLDIDGDSWLDLFVLRVGANQVLRGGPDCSFTDATAALGIDPGDAWSTAFTAWWEDADHPVMAVGNYVDRTDPDGPFGACDDNQLLWPEESEVRPLDPLEGSDPLWIETRYRGEALAPGFCPLSMLAARDARGRMTLRISNDRQYYVRGGQEQMWDIPDRRFLTEEDGWPRVSLWGMGIASRDLDGDGRDEVMLTSMGDQLLQMAQPDGTYVPAPFDMGTYAHIPYTGDDGRPSTGWHAEFGDIDNDGRPDLFIAKGNVDQMPGNAMHDPNNLLMQQADGSFVETALEAGVATRDRSRGAALADLDLDGRLDLVVVNRRAPLELYRNVTEGTGHWLTVALTQPGGNRHAIGARVTVEAGGVRQSQQLTIGGGHAGGEALPLHFGLGTAETASVTITWPDGAETTLDSSADTALVISYGAP
jgi:hypothetical protein